MVRAIDVAGFALPAVDRSLYHIDGVSGAVSSDVTPVGEGFRPLMGIV